MSDSLKSQWRTLRRGRPGRRFQTRYESAKKARAGTSRMGRVFRIIVALGAALVGVVLIFIPGPAILFFFVSAGLLAAESLLVARALDWIDARAEAAWKWLKPRWVKLHLAVKIIVVGVGVAIAGASAYTAYRVLAG